MVALYAKRATATILLVLLVGVGVHSQKRRLTESEAVALAEQFIAVNGYTDLPPDKSKLAYESTEWESDVDNMLKSRHDTLERRAYAVLRNGRGSLGWTVVFRYKHSGGRDEPKVGRAVTMNVDGSKLRVQHQDFFLRFGKKLQ